MVESIIDGLVEAPRNYFALIAYTEHCNNTRIQSIATTPRDTGSTAKSESYE